MHILIVANEGRDLVYAVDKATAIQCVMMDIMDHMNGRVLTIDKDSAGQLTISIQGDLSVEAIDTLRADTTVTHTFLEHEFLAARRPLLVLTDLTAFTGTYAPDAILILAEYMRRNAAFVEKSAIFGGKENTAFIAEIVSDLSERDNVRFFKTREEALAWLHAS